MCMMIRKRPGERLDYLVDFSDWLPDDDSLVTATVTASDGVVVDDVEIVGDAVLVWVFGGEPEMNYHFELQVITEGGRQKTQCVQVCNRQGGSDPLLSGIIAASSGLWVYANFTLHGDTV